MKSQRFFTPFLFLALLITGGCASDRNQSASRPVANTSPSGINVSVSPENLQFVDFHFTSIDTNDPRYRKVVTQNQAVKAALEFEPIGKNASSISTQVGYFDHISVTDLQDQRLVWLVTYHGVDTVSSGPPGSDHHVTHTLTVAVDAFKGVGIVSMTLAIMTPEPEASQTAVVSTKPRIPTPQVREATTGVPSPISEPLTTPIPSNTGLTIEENEIKGSVQIEPLTFQPVYGTQDEVIARHARAKLGRYQMSSGLVNNNFVYYPVTGGKQYRVVEIESSGTEVKGGKISNLSIQVLRGDQVIFTTSAGQSSPISSVRSLWVDGSDWYLEIAFVTNTINGNMVRSDAIGKVFKDGVLLNETYGYDEMFEFQLLDGKPFYFYKKGGQIHVSYNNEDLPIAYEEIPHFRCCSGAEVNPIAGQNWVGFFGRRNGTWYYTEIGQYH